MQIDFRTILFLLGPSSGEPIWNILLYATFIFALIATLTMPDKNLLPTLLVAGVMVATVVAKLSLSVRAPMDPIIGPCDFGMLIINAVMLIFPLLAAGLLRAKKKAKVVIPSIFCAIFGFLFFFAYWFVVQRNC
jgi:hypothetical protein